MKKYIIITADTNDADYFNKKSEITDSEIELLKPIIEVIKQAPPGKRGTRHNWETEECRNDATPEILYIDKGLLTEEQVEFMNKYLPEGDLNYPGIHTITSIEILEVSNEFRLL